MNILGSCSLKNHPKIKNKLFLVGFFLFLFDIFLMCVLFKYYMHMYIQHNIQYYINIFSLRKSSLLLELFVLFKQVFNVITSI